MKLPNGQMGGFALEEPFLVPQISFQWTVLQKDHFS